MTIKFKELADAIKETQDNNTLIEGDEISDVILTILAKNKINKNKSFDIDEEPLDVDGVISDLNYFISELSRARDAVNALTEDANSSPDSKEKEHMALLSSRIHKSLVRFKAYIHVPDLEDQGDYDLNDMVVIEQSKPSEEELKQKLIQHICQEEGCAAYDIHDLSYTVVDQF